MNDTRRLRYVKIVISALLAVALCTGSSFGVDLATRAFDMTMPDGSIVPMWGFVLDGSGCYDLGNSTDRVNCVNGLANTPTVPGPRLTADTTTGALEIRLTNSLPVPVSIVIPGQELPVSAGCSGPVWTDGTSGPRTDRNQRVRSFACEASADGGRQVYIWQAADGTQFQTGTYVYQSGTHPQVQVQMGLYGAVSRDAGLGYAYPGVFFDSQLDLFFSEVDPALHAEVSGGTFSGSTLEYRPKYFLLQSYNSTTGLPEDVTIDVSTIPPVCIDDGWPEGDAILLRMYNMGLRELAPMMIGSHVSLVAEGGKPYPYPRLQYENLLMPGSTKDAIFTPGYGADFKLIERRLNLTDGPVSGGGMQTCFTVAECNESRVYYVDNDSNCGGITPCHATVQAGINDAADRICGSSAVIKVSAFTYNESPMFSVATTLFLDGGWLSDFSAKATGPSTIVTGGTPMTFAGGTTTVSGIVIQ